ncbi:DUF3768 domain-containing protein [Roseovarius nitratireducens]|uniref:DUF3768 domain-containing protein n=1 Tax=Roseovarius nitratireducens TaxID=2044597 RepID=UPI001F0C16FC|nr:DUF3768 domain-containing protein [Roseovarius nitratireducens]
MRDAWAIWNNLTCAWELQATFDRFHCETCGGETEIAWEIDEAFRKKRIRRLNDALRRGDVLHGAIMITSGIESLGEDARTAILRSVQTFSDFSEDNDPHKEHDFGAVDHGTTKVFWKIDYYDRDLTGHSPDAANPEVTHRVLTIMLASEY